MNKDALEKKLENISLPQLPPLQHQQQVKLSILSAKKSAKISLWLLLIPFLFFVSAFLHQQMSISLPPDSWLQQHRLQLPAWLRIAIFAAVMIFIPLIAVVLNLISLIWVQYEKEKKIFNFSGRLKTTNLIIVIIAGAVAFLFLVVMITD